MTKHDLVVRNGTLVIPGIGSVAADVAMADGKIVALGKNLVGDEVYDASGKIVLPGIFDPHVHIGNEMSFEEEAESETRAAEHLQKDALVQRQGAKKAARPRHR